MMMPAMLILMIPFFTFSVVLQSPNSALATGLSLFPPGHPDHHDAADRARTGTPGRAPDLRVHHPVRRRSLRLISRSLPQAEDRCRSTISRCLLQAANNWRGGPRSSPKMPSILRLSGSAGGKGVPHRDPLAGPDPDRDADDEMDRLQLGRIFKPVIARSAAEVGADAIIAFSYDATEFNPGSTEVLGFSPTAPRLSLTIPRAGYRISSVKNPWLAQRCTRPQRRQPLLLRVLVGRTPGCRRAP
jgi:hypothetical protein